MKTNSRNEIKCAVCGASNPKGRKYCKECGEELPSGKSPETWVILLIAMLIVGGSIYLGIRTAINSNEVEIIVTPSVDTMGTVLGGGVYVKDTIVKLVPCPSDGFDFDLWDDGNRDNPRWVKTVEDHKYVAIFKKVEPTNPTDTMKNGKDVPVPLSSIQQEFDELCGRFDLRMKDELTYENALVLITGDYEVLSEILLMLSNSPNLIAQSENYYIERFQTRADEAIKKINDAVFSTSLDSYQREELYSKYIPQKSKIEQIRNSL